MKRREMILRSIQAGAVIPFLKPVETFSESISNIMLSELTGNPLRFPPVFSNGGIMSLANSVVNVWPGQNTNVIAVNESFPGPSVVIQKGETFTADFINNLSEPATSHWHGLSVPELMDGHPKDPIPPGGSYTYTFPVLNRAGTYFYHAHADMLTAKHVYKGFAGFFIVDDPAEIPLGLPRGAFDVPLCIQDRRIADIPEFTYQPVLSDVTRGFLGDTVLVNGTPEAYLEVSKTLYRFRLLNGSNARVYKIAMADNTPFQIIATDGGLKDAPAPATSFFLSPGERVDIVVDFSSYSLGQNVMLKSLTFPASGGGIYRQGVEMNILRFDITGNQSSGGIVPPAFNPIDYYDPDNAAIVRDFTLSMSGGGMGMHRINGLTFEMDRIDWESPLNSLEEWKIINTTNMIHPMHTHESQFQVYSRNGVTDLPPNDKGWKDTVMVNPFETVRLLVKFTQYSGVYLFHCHNLEHEDDGMMLNFRIADNPLPVELSSFYYSMNERDITLLWTTISELNNRGFDIEKLYLREATQNEWTKIGFVTGKGTTSGEANYTFTEKNLSSGRYKYRLKQIDFNGNTRYYLLESEVVIGSPDDYLLKQNYPNPFNPSTMIGYRLASDGFVKLRLFDMNGKEKAVLVNERQRAGHHEVEFNSLKSGLSSGTYIYRLEAGSFVSEKKMMLLK